MTKESFLTLSMVSGISDYAGHYFFCLHYTRDYFHNIIMLPFVLNDYIIRDGLVYAQWYCFQLFGMTLVALVDSDGSFRHLRLEPVVTANNTFSAGVLTNMAATMSREAHNVLSDIT